MASAAYSLEARDLEFGAAPDASTAADARAVPPWMEPTLAAVLQLIKLPPNWDHRGARPVSSGVAKQGIGLLCRTVPFSAPDPDVVPTVAGGLQFEWHQHNVDIELEVQPDLRVHLYWRDRLAAREQEAELWPHRPVALEEALDLLTQRHIALDVAAR